MPSSASCTAGAAVAAAAFVPSLSPKYRSITSLKIFALTDKVTPRINLYYSTCSSNSTTVIAAAALPRTSSTAPSPTTLCNQRHWMVLMEAPPQQLTTKPQVINYYVDTLERVLGSEEDAQKCMYDVSCDTDFGFCCDIDAETANALADMPGVLFVKPDPDFETLQKDYSRSSGECSSHPSHYYGSKLLFPPGTTKHWLVRMSRPAVGAMRKAQLVDYYTKVLMRVLGSEKDAQMCIYHVSWQSNYGFCCELDDECAHDLAGMHGVLSVQPDRNFGLDDKDYIGEPSDLKGSSGSTLTSNIKTKKLFVTGLSFYTSEKTLRTAFEDFGEVVDVKVIMDKISKRSKGYAFVEYSTEEAASIALREMNGKIINGWMITVDVAKRSPPKYNNDGLP